MKFTFITLFPPLIEHYFNHSMFKRALDKSILSVEFLNPRNFSKNKHKKTDTCKSGGDAGMVFSPEPLFNCLKAIKDLDENTYFIFPTPAGKKIKQTDVKRLSHKDHIAFVCGRYDGIDERVVESFIDEVFCIGDIILSGGELASLSICEAISRNIKGFLGNIESLKDESFSNFLLQEPVFARPRCFNDRLIPFELLSGNHSKIRFFRRSLSKMKTIYFRPDLYRDFTLRKKIEE